MTASTIKKIKKWVRFRVRRHGAGVFFVSMPGSGRTWLAVMLSHYYHLTAGAPVDRIIKQASFYRGHAGIPRFLLAHPGQLWGRLDPADAARLHRGKRTIFLIRDPRDTALSIAAHAHYRVGGDSPGPGLGAPDAGEGDGSLARVAGQVQRLKRVGAVAALLDDRLIVSYEQLRAAPNATLERVVAFLDGSPGHTAMHRAAVDRAAVDRAAVDRAAVDRAVAFASFEELRRKEAAGFFRTQALQPSDPEEPESFKVRHGRVAGYRNNMPAEVAAAADFIVARELPADLRALVEQTPPVDPTRAPLDAPA